MVADAESIPYLVADGELRRWEPDGYGRSMAKPDGIVLRVLTPPSIVRAIIQGYPVMVHSSARG
jgi:hypothetical protein